jgi:putative ATP-binding cassette transporter
MPELFIGLVAFAFLGTVFTILIGKKLVKLNFEMLQREADFRFSLVRVRENAESIAFYSGESVEEKETDRRLIRVIANATLINMAQLRLNLFTISYDRLTWILPIMMVAPEYFAGIVELGVVQQARVAFDHILGDLSIIISEFQSIAQFSAGIERLFSFLNVMQRLDEDRDVGKELLLQDPSRYEKKPDETVSETISSETSTSLTTKISVKDIELPTTGFLGTRINILTISDLKLVTPDNKRVLAENLNMSLGEDKSLLIVGASGMLAY